MFDEVLRIPVGHPFDTVKVNLQCNPRYGAGLGGMRACFGAIVREHGVLGLYKGAQSPLAGMAEQQRIDVACEVLKDATDAETE